MRPGGVDRFGIAGMLEDFGALDAAPHSAAIKRVLDTGIGMFLADHDGLGERLMGFAPAMKRSREVY